ncbi:MAG: hypothetical protein COB66_06470 [Coxiella sp. (in: Bacteria)]|nr:MAG: hypothetical protein COB66_06470 [Coxiella sp. (in: g-proteobacteria)]
MKKEFKKAIAGSYIIDVIEYLDCHQILDSKQLLAEHSIKFEQLSSNRYFLTRDQYIGLMTAILKQVDRNDLIQYLVSKLHITQHGLVGLLSLCSFNIRQALKMVIRFYTLRTHLVTIEFSETETDAIIRVTPTYELHDTAAFTVEMALAAMHTAKQQILNIDNPSDRLCFSHDGDTDQHFMTDRITYNSPYNALIFPATDLDHKLKSTDKATFDLLSEQCEQLLPSDESNDITSRVNRHLQQCAEGFPTHTHIAEQLAMSPRTLSRHLNAAGHTYQKLLDQERIKRTKQLLLDTDLSVTEIAMYLYFTDASHLTKIFKQYTQKTPRQYRNIH